MKLCMNGDDLGYTMANTLGIFQAYRDGILRSTTALTNSAYSENAAELSRQYPGLGIGVHLTLTLDKPLTENKTLHDENGMFWTGRTTIWTKDPDYNEIYQEWKAQIERFISIFGRKPTHLDSHHSVHDATEQALKVATDLAKEYGLCLRRYNDRFEFCGKLYGPTFTKENLIAVLEENKGKDLEIMCHPGWCDLELYRKSSYAAGRVQELDVLCSEQVKQYVAENGIELCHY